MHAKIKCGLSFCSLLETGTEKLLFEVVIKEGIAKTGKVFFGGMLGCL